MTNHYELNDQEFEQEFEHCVLNPAIFSHEAHLRLAWIHIQKYGLDQAIINISQQLTAFVEHVGAKDKYNKTLTVAAVKAVYHFINKSSTDNFYDFIQENPRLLYNFRELMQAHYREDIFNLPLAKKVFLEPDLLPFT